MASGRLSTSAGGPLSPDEPRPSSAKTPTTPRDTHHTKDKVQRHPLHPSKRGCRPKPTPRTPQNLLKSRNNSVDVRQSREGMRDLPNLSQSWPQPLPVRTQGGGKKRDLWLVVALTFLLRKQLVWHATTLKNFTLGGIHI